MWDKVISPFDSIEEDRPQADNDPLDLSFLSYQGTYPSPTDGWDTFMQKLNRNGLEQPFHPSGFQPAFTRPSINGVEVDEALGG